MSHKEALAISLADQAWARMAERVDDLRALIARSYEDKVSQSGVMAAHLVLAELSARRRQSEIPTNPDGD